MEAAVVGKIDLIRGQMVKIFIALKLEFKPNSELKEGLARFVKHAVASYKAPRELEL